MIHKVQRYFLEIKHQDFKNLKNIFSPNKELILKYKKNFELNKFFYKQIGADHFWRDRLIWSDKEWKEYVSNQNLQTCILKKKENLIGYYEQEFHPNTNEVELINLGILKEYRNFKYGSYLLSNAIIKAIKFNPNRIWVHTCSLDHKNALENYLSRGFKIFKKEDIDYVA